MITTLIPAFKPQYLNELLTALQVQTVKPARVIVSDDSPDGAFLRILSDPAHADIVRRLNLEVVPGPRRGAWANCQQLLRLHAGRTPLLHLLLDDDIPYPSFYARHLAAHELHRGGCVVSRRWYAFENGQPVGDLPVPPELDARIERVLALPSAVLFPTVIGKRSNWLGEYSNVTFRSEWVEALMQPSIGGVRINGLEDIGALLMLSQQAPLVWLNEHLGYFRASPHQGSQQPLSRNFKRGVLAWVALALGSLRAGHIDAALARASIAHSAQELTARYGAESDVQPFLVLLPGLTAGDAQADAEFLRLWEGFAA